MLNAQSLQLGLTLELAMPASHSDARVRKLKAQSSKAQSSKLRLTARARGATPVIRDALLRTRRYLNPNIPILNGQVIALQ